MGCCDEDNRLPPSDPFTDPSFTLITSNSACLSSPMISVASRSFRSAASASSSAASLVSARSSSALTLLRRSSSSAAVAVRRWCSSADLASLSVAIISSSELTVSSISSSVMVGAPPELSRPAPESPPPDSARRIRSPESFRSPPPRCSRCSRSPAVRSRSRSSSCTSRALSFRSAAASICTRASSSWHSLSSVCSAAWSLSCALGLGFAGARVGSSAPAGPSVCVPLSSDRSDAARLGTRARRGSVGAAWSATSSTRTHAPWPCRPVDSPRPVDGARLDPAPCDRRSPPRWDPLPSDTECAPPPEILACAP